VKNIIAITGAASGFGALAARALARAGYIVYGTAHPVDRPHTDCARA